MPTDSTREQSKFKTVVASPDFHATVRAIAFYEQKEINQVCDSMFLALAKKRLAKLKQKAEAA